jgi:hypothetical protein
MSQSQDRKSRGMTARRSLPKIGQIGSKRVAGRSDAHSMNSLRSGHKVVCISATNPVGIGRQSQPETTSPPVNPTLDVCLQYE